MDRRLTAVMLAGTLRPTPLREALDVPVLRLPVGRVGTLLDAWLGCLGTISCLDDVRIVVNSEGDAETVRSLLGRWARNGAIRAIAEPASWRGAGGILRDVMGEARGGSAVVVCEANALPPDDLAPVLEELEAGSAGGIVGVYGADEPGGVYAFRRALLGRIPSIGYHDLKEQFLPSLAGSGVEIRTAALSGRPTSLRDLGGYLAAAGVSLGSEEGGERRGRISSGARVSGSATVDGLCVVEEGVVVEDGAVIHDAVLLVGATIGVGAVVSRSIVGPCSAVPAQARVIGEVVFDAHRAGPGAVRAVGPREAAALVRPAGGGRR